MPKHVKYQVQTNLLYNACTFDYNEEENTAFVYYVNNTLYLQFGEQYVKMDGFGGTSTFKLFYETITTLDMEQTLFSVNFANNIELRYAVRNICNKDN